MADTAKSLLLQAQTEANPFTRQVSKQLAVTSVVLLALSLLVAFFPTVVQMLSAATAAVSIAFISSLVWLITAGADIVSMLASAAVSLSKLSSAAFKSFSGLYGMTVTIASLFALSAWYRARRYVMQSAVDIALKSELPVDEGQKLVKGFTRTHSRVKAVLIAIFFMCTVQCMLSADARPPGPLPIEDALMLIANLFTWIAIMIAALVTASINDELSEKNIAAYALFRGSRMSTKQFVQDLAVLSEDRFDWACSMAAKLKASGLFEIKESGPFMLVQQSLKMAKYGAFEGRPALD